MVFAIVFDDEDDAIRDKLFLDELEREALGHFFDDGFGLLESIGVSEDLARAEALMLGAMILDVADADAFPAPAMVDEKFGIDAEESVE